MLGSKTKRAVCAVLAAVMLATVALMSACNRNDVVPVVLEGIYPASSLPDYSAYMAEAQITALVGGENIAVFNDDANKAYVNGAYVDIGDPILYYNDDDVLVIDGARVATTMGRDANGAGVEAPQAVADKMELKYIVFDKELVILSANDITANVFDDMYTLEALSLRLKGAEETETLNAFIKLPDSIGNNVNNTVYYTSADLNLGVQTSVYYTQMGDATVTAGPALVAGQGNNRNNNTIVRVFNRQQVCTAQFLAFPSAVRGGVRVAAGAYTKADGNKETLIATAAFDASQASARYVRVFDEFGTLRYSISVDGVEAPYAIMTGQFISGDNDEYLAVMSASQSGNSAKLNIYSFADASIKKSVTLNFSEDVSAQNISISRREADERDTLILYFTDTNYACELDLNAESVTRLDLEIPDNATGVYSSAFDDFAVTMNDGTFSYITVYSASRTGTLVNVGWRENRFYSTYAKDNEDGYIDHATFLHLRADLGSKIMGRIGSEKRAIAALANTDFDGWAFQMSTAQKRTYHNSYNMWEPCFTHRWNRTTQMDILSKMTDDDGNPLYASIGRDNKGGEYLELNSSFLIGTYADGLLPMDKLRLYPLRTFLQDLAVEFRGENAEPERLVAVSPVHEQEINVANSVGDYHPNMILGFRNYLLGLYGSLENINTKFGTNFATLDDFDAPRFNPEVDMGEARGQWDIYGESDFFTQWSLYTRFIINKRIMEAYREALLAGFPPEAINAHQIPEADAVAGLLGEVNTRLSPVEAVTACGTAYGGTRYGFWCADEKNFVNLAFMAGHTNITLGEYGSMERGTKRALEQLTYMFEHGVRMTHIIVPYAEGSTDQKKSMEAEQKAIDSLQEANNPRTVNTGITTDILPVTQGEASYNIVQMSKPNDDGSMQVGLLKSVLADGSWEGTVYVAPFHALIEVSEADMKGTVKDGYKTSDIKSLQYGDQVELTVNAKRGSTEAKMVIKVFNDDCLINSVTYDLTETVTPYRYVLSNQLTLGNVRIEMSFESEGEGLDGIVLENLSCTAQYENIAHKYFGDTDAAASYGGVTFDLLTRDMAG